MLYIYNKNIRILILNVIYIYIYFRKKTVIKFILPEVSLIEVKNEIEAVQKTNFLNFTPKLLDWNIEHMNSWWEGGQVQARDCVPIG